MTLLLLFVLGAAVFTGCQERDAITKELDNAKNNVMEEANRLQNTAGQIGEAVGEVQKGLDAAGQVMDSAQKVQNTADAVTTQYPR